MAPRPCAYLLVVAIYNSAELLVVHLYLAVDPSNRKKLIVEEYIFGMNSVASIFG